MRVASWAISSKLGDIHANLETIRECLTKVDADLHIFPELFLTGYNLGDDLQRLALEAGGIEETVLSGLAIEFAVHIIVGAPTTPRAGITYNSALLIDDEGMIQVVHKRYLPTFTTFEEGLFFAKGDDQAIWQTRIGNFGVGICYDLYFPELHQSQAQHGADILVNISASPSMSRRFFEALLPARAIENACFQLYSNNVGSQNGLAFWGGSGGWGPRGDNLGNLNAYEEGAALFELDLSQLRAAREFRPTLRDR